MTMLQKVLLLFTAVMLVFSLFANVTGLQLAPFIVLGILVYFHTKQDKVNLYIVCLSLIMAVLNMFIYSWLDVVIWGLFAIAYWK